MWLWLKAKWYVLVGVIGVFILWLRFFHDPIVRKESELKERKRVLYRQYAAYKNSKKDTQAQEEAIENEIEQLDRELDRLRAENVDADDAAAALRKRFGWDSTNKGSGS